MPIDKLFIKKNIFGLIGIGYLFGFSPRAKVAQGFWCI
jgi:hypothetical protein